MIRFLFGLILMYGAADWIERDNITNALLCVAIGALLMFSASRSIRRQSLEDRDGI